MSISKEQLLKNLCRIQKALCAYQSNKFCDCKYMQDSDRDSTICSLSENGSGCPEIKQTIELIQAMPICDQNIKQESKSKKMIVLDKTSPELVVPEADPILMYVVVNADLQLSPAKLAVQVGHGVELHFKEMSMKTNLSFSDEYRKYVEPHRQWMNSGSRKIVLKANTIQWNKIKECDEIEAYLVIDAGITECEPNTETCIVLPPRRKSTIHKLIKRLQLL